MKKDFFRRLKLYAFGLLLGSILSYMIFGDRLIDYFKAWLPEGRVKSQIQITPLKISYSVDSSFQANHLSSNPDYVKDVILKSDVVFSKSNVHKNCPEYYIKTGSLPFDLWIIVCKDSTFVSSPIIRK
jgi:hypothetical protein